MSLRKNKSQEYDWLTIFMVAVWAIFGWLMVVAVDYRDEGFTLFDWTSQHGKQLIWIGTSAVLATLILLLDYRFIDALAYPYYLAVMGLLLVTFLVAPEIKGSKSWLFIGPVSIQSAEFAKAATALALAKVITAQGVSLHKLRGRILALGVMALPIGLIILQGDTGSAIVFTGLVLVLFREGFPVTLPLIGISMGLLFVLTILYGALAVVIGLSALWLVFFLFLARDFKHQRPRMVVVTLIWLASAAFSYFAVESVFYNVLEPHQQTRINVLLGKEFDPGATYNVMQSKIAISSGGWMGKGYLEGTLTKGDFVPEQSTDFIFSTVGEELGFAGTSMLIVFMVLFMLRIIKIAERQRSHFTRVYGYGVVSILFMHFFVNIGMAIGMLPVVGIPLPFISYGGSSMWGFTILIFLLLKLDANRKLVLR